MEPTLKSGSYALGYRAAKYAIDDIIACRINNQILIKRITMATDAGYTVHGDNPHDSYDSRDFGIISQQQILSKIIWY